MNTTYPEHAKLSVIRDESQKCGEFLEWLEHEKGYTLHHYVEGSEHAYPVYESTQSLLAEFFGIDHKKLSAEKDAIINDYRSFADKRSSPQKETP
jgi:hypothetical protein